ncbi:MAG: type II toxin-antitoxin system RelE/ParE family toxin [Methylobacter sp.]|uniref:type II toxin-antitoxin system RelE/ParE family toxin n=1 Tax=Methylobacter sp. TaxID=2051955 RepID=UPI002730C473|nr:type II toxin-antitoxin system RelE/ParE family toxin [Methylobacter sp.]MDP1666532.1 type II toxin-antitoxin system RelE/ParE family toxin [Methylobacter sp.]MDP1970962.1 type II toxin-antitoxin system RelE/ParE family toxin [Methylobacter sp.]
MNAAITEVKSLLERLPEESTYEDIQCHLYAVEKIRRSIYWSGRSRKNHEPGRCRAEIRSMAYKVSRSPETIENLQSIADYIAKHSRVYAQSVIAKVFDVSRSLGRTVTERWITEIRERFVYSYRLIYQIEGNKTLIVAVIHGKRSIKNISDRSES